MTSHWNTVQPIIHHFDGRVYNVPDFVAFNWMHSRSACAYIKYAYCVHPAFVKPGEGNQQYDDYWHEFVEIRFNQTGGQSER